jgi:hypothetical protein
MKIETRIDNMLYKLMLLFEKYKGEKGNTQFYIKRYFKECLYKAYKKGISDKTNLINKV